MSSAAWINLQLNDYRLAPAGIASAEFFDAPSAILEIFAESIGSGEVVGIPEFEVKKKIRGFALNKLHRRVDVTTYNTYISKHQPVERKYDFSFINRPPVEPVVEDRLAKATKRRVVLPLASLIEDRTQLLEVKGIASANRVSKALITCFAAPVAEQTVKVLETAGIPSASSISGSSLKQTLSPVAQNYTGSVEKATISLSLRSEGIPSEEFASSPGFRLNQSIPVFEIASEESISLSELVIDWLVKPVEMIAFGSVGPIAFGSAQPVKQALTIP